MPLPSGQLPAPALHRLVLAYLFERFPKFSQTFCYREVAELFRQGERPAIFSLRGGDKSEQWNPEIVAAVHQLPEGDAFAKEADAARKFLDRASRKILRDWRGRRDSLRLHQAVYVGARLQKIGVTHLHAHFAGMAARTAFWINKFFGIDFGLTVHANDIFVPHDFEIGLPEIFARGKAIVAVSDFAADYLRAKFPEEAGRIHRVYNGIDLAQFQPAHFQSPPLILSIGRLISKKGFDILIDACASLREREFRCEIIGDGPLLDKLQERINQYGLGERVKLVGEKSQTEITRSLREATIFALPCRIDPNGAMDNLPTVIMEAMASSLPVVTTDVGGISEMVRDGETGFVVAQNDAGLVASAVDELTRNGQQAREFGERGRDRCADLFSIKKNVKALRQVFATPSSRAEPRDPVA